MRVPRLTEVFVREANVTTLAQMNKLPLPVAQAINDFDRQWAPQLAKIYASRGNTNAPGHDAGYAEAWMKGFGKRIVRFLQNNRARQKELVDLAGKDWREFLSQMRTDLDTHDSKNMAKRADLKFPDGSYWVKLEPGECEKEGEMMQHCGAAMGDMWSLRDAQGRPHVTLDVTRDGNAIQIRGKQNNTPDRKYWEKLKGIFRKEKWQPRDPFILKSQDGQELADLLTQAGLEGGASPLLKPLTPKDAADLPDFDAAAAHFGWDDHDQDHGEDPDRGRPDNDFGP